MESDEEKKTIKKRLKEIRATDLCQAVFDSALTWVVSTLVPILLLWLISALMSRPGFSSWKGLSVAFDSYFVPPEILIYVTAIIAPTLTFMVMHWRARKHEGWFFTTFFLVVALIVVAAIIYAFAKAHVPTNSALVSTLATVSYIVSLVIWVLVVRYEKRLPRLLEAQRHESGSTIMEALR